MLFLLVGIYIGKAMRSLSKQGQLQPHVQSKGQASKPTTVKWSIGNYSEVNDINNNY